MESVIDGTCTYIVGGIEDRNDKKEEEVVVHVEPASYLHLAWVRISNQTFFVSKYR